MLIFKTGDMFQSSAQTLINTVNCVGVMGKGVALAFRERFPAMFDAYRAQCQAGSVLPGLLALHKETQPWVLNFPTKFHWKGKSQLRYIEAGLEALASHSREWGIESLAMPALGCGHGGLDWAVVRPIIEKHLADLDIPIEVFEPGSQIGTVPEDVDVQPHYTSDLFGLPVKTPKRKVKSRRR